jgi:hypothetical protein
MTVELFETLCDLHDRVTLMKTFKKKTTNERTTDGPQITFQQDHVRADASNRKEWKLSSRFLPMAPPKDTPDTWFSTSILVSSFFFDYYDWIARQLIMTRLSRLREWRSVSVSTRKYVGWRAVAEKREKTNNAVFHYYFKNWVSLFITALACNDHRPSSIIIVQLVWLHIQIFFQLIISRSRSCLLFKHVTVYI